VDGRGRLGLGGLSLKRLPMATYLNQLGAVERGAFGENVEERG
jgi:hypothetical protein